VGAVVAATLGGCTSSSSSAGAQGAGLGADGSVNDAGAAQDATASGDASLDGTTTTTASDGGAEAAPVAAGAADGSFAAAAVHWLGRVDTSPPNPGALGRFSWSASGLAATVSGSTIAASLQTEGATSSAFFTPVIDGTAGARFQVMAGAAQTVTLATGLSAGTHTVELYRETEGSYGDDVFYGFPDASLGPPPATSARLIEVVGDSISAGYGNLGVETHTADGGSCGFTLDTESAYASYGAMLARLLGAEVSIVARSGWGMYRDGTGNTSNVVPSVYGDTLGDQATPAWSFARQPDAVVINLGTNDAITGDPGAPFETAYVAFLHTVRGHYPGAWIFLTVGTILSGSSLSTMQAHLTNVVTTMNDAKITTIALAPESTLTTGCQYHPNVAEDTAMAQALAPTMQAKLGW
jgi:lysophospholipase L1-like esterase